MNPDADINVCAVYPDGTLVIYADTKVGEPRRRLRAMHFANYGTAKLWADEYEANARREREARRK